MKFLLYTFTAFIAFVTGCALVICLRLSQGDAPSYVYLYDSAHQKIWLSKSGEPSLKDGLYHFTDALSGQGVMLSAPLMGIHATEGDAQAFIASQNKPAAPAPVAPPVVAPLPPAPQPQHAKGK